MNLNLFEPFKNILSQGLHSPENLHPLIVHFPIALLVVVPLFILLGIIFKKSSKHFLITSAILLTLGTAGIYFAYETGEEAGEGLPSNITSDVLSTLGSHDDFAQKTKIFFTALTVIFILYIFFVEKLSKYKLFGAVTFLIASLLGLILLFNTAHYGGKLVHQHGVHSSLFKNPTQ